MAPQTEIGVNEEQEQAGKGTEIAGMQSLCKTDRECSQATDRVLSTQIDESILRGVSSRVLLRRCGSAFREHEFNPANYEESFEAASLDDFVSHDWGSSAVSKVIALCLIYNGLPAAAASLAVGVLLAAAESQRFALLPGPPRAGPVAPGEEGVLYGYWCQAICPVVFVLVFFCWQDVRATLRLGTRSAFLDKYCIDQTDGERKAAGILGLGGFLRHTDRFIICWTPRYFTRLWCTYEVASWLFLDKPLSSVLFMPLSHAQSIGVGFVASTGVCWLFACGSFFFPAYYMVVLGVAIAIVSPASTHFWRRFTREIRDLPKQLDEFSITQAACFCCSNGHRPPNNPEVEILCDKHLVHRTVAQWFPTRVSQRGGPNNLGHVSPAELKAFDSAVRDLFGPWVLKSAGPTRVPYKYIVLMSTPFAFRMLDAASSVGRNSNAYLIMTLVGLYPATILSMIPVMYKLSLHLVCVFDSSVGTLKNGYLDAVATLCLTVLIMLLVAILWVPINIASSIFPGPLPTFVVAVLLFFFAALVFADELVDIMPSCLRPCGRSRAAFWARTGGSTGAERSQEPHEAGSAAGEVRWQMWDSAEADEVLYSL